MPKPMDVPNNREEQLFEAARCLKNRAARQAYLDEACAEDLDLRKGVERLLDADRGAKSFFADGAVALTESISAIANAEQPGDCIGRYKLLQKLGKAAAASCTWPSRSDLSNDAWR